MRKWIALSAVVMLVTGADALADGMGYTYIQAELLSPAVKNNGRSTHGSGYGLEGAFGIGSHLFVFGHADRTSYDRDSTDYRFRTGSLGVGGHLPLSRNLDLVGTVSFESVNLRLLACCSTYVEKYADEGWGAGLGLRGWLTDRVQLFGDLEYGDIGALDSMAGIAVGIRYSATPAVALGLTYMGRQYDRDTADMGEVILLFTVRYHFGRS